MTRDEVAKMARADEEATAFAMALLMPEIFVREAVGKMNGVDIADDRAVEKLAKQFQVPNAVMAYRLGQLFGNYIVHSLEREIE